MISLGFPVVGRQEDERNEFYSKSFFGVAVEKRFLNPFRDPD